MNVNEYSKLTIMCAGSNKNWWKEPKKKWLENGLGLSKKTVRCSIPDKTLKSTETR